MKNSLIYFDHAATGYPKPGAVLKATMEAFGKYGGNPGRSGHRLSVAASKAIYECREQVCRLLSFDMPERVVFTPNATYALNMAITGLVKKNSHILISNFEHNSVIRPVHALSENLDKAIRYSMFDASGHEDEKVVSEFTKSIRPDTKLAVVTASSNICGKILPVKEISKVCKNHGIKLIVDAAQGCGEFDINMKSIGADVICSAGHKALYGPTGTGFAVFGEDTEPESIIFGGNGIFSKDPHMGGEMPERLEAGTLNTFGICGLSEGIKFILGLGIEEIHQRTYNLCSYITDGLLELGCIVYGNYSNKTPIILFNVPGIDCSEVSSYLDGCGICTRSGFHCAPGAHRALGTENIGGVRVSLGYSSTKAEASRFLAEMSKFLKTV